MPKAASSRRQLIVFILLGLALVGGAMRLWTPRPSVAHDIGNLLLVLWVPVIGNVVAWLVRRARMKMQPVRGFVPGSAFTPDLQAELAALPDAAGAAGQDTFTLVVGTDGFTARLPAPMPEWAGSPQARTVEFQLLRPALAIPRLKAAGTFAVLVGETVVANGRVLKAPP
jgi:hypothetical protein